MDIYPPGSMTSTHTGNPLCSVAALTNLRIIRDEKLVEHSREMGDILQPALRAIGKRFPEYIGAVHGKGLVGALHMVKPGGIEPNPELASRIVRRCIEKGLMLFSPVGYRGSSVKIAPPLVIEEDALRVGVSVVEEAIEEVVQEMK